jgi:hypothetical protein
MKVNFAVAALAVALAVSPTAVWASGDSPSQGPTGGGSGSGEGDFGIQSQPVSYQGPFEARAAVFAKLREIQAAFNKAAAVCGARPSLGANASGYLLTLIQHVQPDVYQFGPVTVLRSAPADVPTDTVFTLVGIGQAIEPNRDDVSNFKNLFVKLGECPAVTGGSKGESNVQRSGTYRTSFALTRGAAPL